MSWRLANPARVTYASRSRSHAVANDKRSEGEAKMRIHWSVIAGVAVALATPTHAQQDRLQQAAAAMGAASLKSIQYTGSGSVYSFGQGFEPGERFPRFIQRSCNASINYQTPA